MHLSQGSYLTLVEDLLVDFTLECLRRLRPLQDLVLTKREEGVKDKLPGVEAGNQLLPLKARAVDELDAGGTTGELEAKIGELEAVGPMSVGDDVVGETSTGGELAGGIAGLVVT